MALLSPGTEIKEIDASVVTPRSGGSSAVYVGDYTQGPVDEITLIGSSISYVETFGKPNSMNMNQWYQPYNFLQYNSGYIYVTRSVGSTAVNSSVEAEVNGGDEPTSIAQLIKNKADWDVKSLGGVAFGTNEDNVVTTTLPADLTYQDTYIIENTSVDTPIDLPMGVYNIIDGSVPYSFELISAQTIEIGGTFDVSSLVSIVNDDNNTKLKFLARNPGVWGDGIKVAIANANDFGGKATAFPGIVVDDQFEYAPEEGQIAILVSYKDVLVESYIVSLDELATDFAGKNIYIENIINERSSFIFVKNNASADESVTSKLWADKDGNTIVEELVLNGGVNGTATQSEIMTGYELYSNVDDLDVDIIIANEIVPVSAMNLAESRKDCVAYVGVPFESCVGKNNINATAAIVEWTKTGEFNTNSTYTTLYGNYKFQYDKFTGKNIWVNIAGDMAGIRARTNEEQELWYASAGTTRGAIKNVKQFAFTPSKPQQDALYQNKTNIVTSLAGAGNVVWGNKTYTNKPSAFDRINVRNLFNHVERTIYKLSRDFTFEFNDAFTRNSFLAAIEPFLNGVQAGRGISEFRAICDTTNNTPQVIQQNEFVADIIIKPTYVAEFFTLRFTAVNASTSIDTIIG